MKAFRHYACLFVLGLGARSYGLEIPVIVQEPAGIARVSEPVSGGISLPAGMFRPGEANFALYEGDRQIPLQVSELVVGPKGFVRWVLLDFQLHIEANETRTLTLKTGATIKPGRALKVVQSEESVKVDTGRIAFEVAKNKPFGLVENVTAGGKAIVSEGQVSYIDGLADRRYTADVPSFVGVHYAGPMRATIEVRGKFRCRSRN